MTALRSAGGTHPGHRRDVNEDRFHVDALRGLFLVVDGVGGQAAGGKAADTAVAMVRARLERETGPIDRRVREAIAAANNEIHRLAALRAEWAGMACVLTAAVVDGGRVVIGHVGDTRLYKIRSGRIDKITRDHSPVGEREDAGEIAELDAMRHPRRHQVYRDVGSEAHAPSDPGFIDVVEIPFEPDAALLMCSDGLTDLVPSGAIHDIVSRLAGDPEQVVEALVAAANAAGGKDNVTVVYVEGDRFAPDITGPLRRADPPEVATRRARLVSAFVLAALLAAAAVQTHDRWPAVDATAAGRGPSGGVIVVKPSDSIMAAMNRAARGASVVVEPGEYRERIRLRDGIRLVSATPRGATIRLPSHASEGDSAVVADGVSDAAMTGFRIVGDAATPLGTGVSIRNASVSIVDVEITGAAEAAIDIRGMSGGTIVAADAHGNPGAALRVGTGATTRISHSAFAAGGGGAGHAASLLVEAGAYPVFSRNTFLGIAPAALVTMEAAARARATRDNWFIEQEAAPEALRRRERNR
jgi:serine/threonine protein phosphatase PrpC